MSIREWLGLAPAGSRDDDSDVVRRIVGQLESMDPVEARHLALFAFLLARVANVDLDVTAAETGEMERLIEKYGGLPPAQAALVTQIAKAQNRLLGPTHNFLAAREFRDIATREQKQGLLHCLFAIAASDGSISSAEEEEVRLVSRTLLLEDADYLAIRSAYSGKRSVMKRG